MGRADYRGGKAPIRTAVELSQILPIPLFLLVEGYASKIFPTTNPASPSVAAGIIAGKTIPATLRPQMRNVLPVWIHWTQWRDVVVPLLEDERVTSWKGVLIALGDLLDLPADVYGPDGVIVFNKGAPVGFSSGSSKTPSNLYAPICGKKAQQLIEQYSLLILERAQTAGY
jgi:hypothetical protein